MAFNFRNKNAFTQSNKPNFGPQDDLANLPKLSSAQLNKLAKIYPAWLRDGSNLKQLPGVYQGVLGQVQLQFTKENGNRLLNKQSDYMNRFTDTERVHQLLSASRLPNETLATIWAHVNKTFPGRLTNREVCLALALIAIFQRLEKEGIVAQYTPANDPFNSVKFEKKPPVPILYSSHTLPVKTHLSTSSSAQNHSSSKNLLIDIGDDDNNESIKNTSEIAQNGRHKTVFNNNNSSIQTSPPKNAIVVDAFSLIDMDGDRFEIMMARQTQIWLRLMLAMKAVFKRSFDILNVEHSRQSALEALRSSKGEQFSKQLCLCYPLTHNIKSKIDELSTWRSHQESDHRSSLFDQNYIAKINDIMISINEYWAVLINLFHESGQTKFIELIMDGLTYNEKKSVSGMTPDQLMGELDTANRTDICCICHTKSYIDIHHTTDTSHHKDLVTLDDYQQGLLTVDNSYYYHARCANFWLNNVDDSGLPLHKPARSDILTPVAPELSRN